MNKKFLPKEALQAIACLTMLLDHIGANFVPGFTLRIIGRIAFPIFCFLLADGVFYTKNPTKYAMRLAISLLLSEIPFDLALKHRLTWESQSVMVTMLLGFCALELLKHSEHDWQKLLIAFGSYFLGNYTKCDYGGYGVLLIILFGETRDKLWLQGLILLMISWMMNSVRIPFLGTRVPIELFSVLCLIPLALYNGKKATGSKAVQLAFYSFYPVHLLVLYLIRVTIYGS